MEWWFGSRRKKMAPICFFLLLQIGVIAVHAQSPSTQGFISIDCGSTAKYTDTATGIPYVSDSNFTDTGVDFQISSDYFSSSLDLQLLTLRSFPNSSRSCYVLTPVTQYNKYSLRATFLYGNYDGENSASSSKPIQFDLYIDVNFWIAPEITDAKVTYQYEAVVVALADSIAVCLVNTGTGTPFISTLELRPLPNAMYPAVNATQYLVLFDSRRNVGTPADSARIRYPDDPNDLIWYPWTDNSGWSELSTTEVVEHTDLDFFKPPTQVMQTAATPTSGSVLKFYWSAQGVPNNEFYCAMCFAEFLPSTSRIFNVDFNGYNLGNFTPSYLRTNCIYNSIPLFQANEYHWALNATNPLLPPFLNAIEVFTAMNLSQPATDSGDVTAINAIKKQYQVKRIWTADPCAPKSYPWNGLNCSYGTDSPRIISLNLSSSGLTGNISSSFARLKVIEYLDLSHNNLTGSIPDSLGSLSSLQDLNLAGNNLSGTIPASLVKRSNQGLLNLRCDGNPYLSNNGTSPAPDSKHNSSTAIIVALCVVGTLLILIIVLLIVSKVKRPGLTQGSYISASNHKDKRFPFENQQFTYKELQKITNGFMTIVGKGGFGSVFLGRLEDGSEIAVKMLSQSSSQGTKEFYAEVQNLTRIHHKNLVNLVGYCMEEAHLALVYEFMPQGTLQDHLTGQIGSGLSWGQRLQIAIEAAEGLDYLHVSCRPAVIHRDVKSANILLTENLEAKIADFGLSRACNYDDRGPISTTVVGTPGYLDPEYHNCLQLSDRSDVYSFGVVLFELITGQPPIVNVNQYHMNVTQWTRQRLSTGIIENVVDIKLRGEYDINSMWKTTDLALRCTESTGDERPSMTDVVVELKESLMLERASNRPRSHFPPTNNQCYHTEAASETNHNSASSTFEMEVNFATFAR